MKNLSQQELKAMIASMTADDLYEPNDMELLPQEAEILQRYLNAAPNHLFVDMPDGYWTGDEMAALKRHGFKLGVIAPFESLFYEASKLVLASKEVSTPEFTEKEIALIKNSDDFKVTKTILIEICHRHGFSRFKKGYSHSFVSMESTKEPMAKGLMNVLIERGLMDESELTKRGKIDVDEHQDRAA